MKGYTHNSHYAHHDIDNREFDSDAKSRREIAREGYEIDGQKYTIRFDMVPKLSIENVSKWYVKYCLTVSLMNINALRE